MKTFIACILVAWTGGAWGGTIYVRAGAAGANSGTSWANAYTELAAALATAQAGDEIWVAAGTYKPTKDFDRTKSFAMKAGVGMYGGFAGTETERAARDWQANKTILSGDIGVAGNRADNAYHVVVGADDGVLDGFIVTGGNAGNANGGGMVNNSASPTIAHCTFSSNSTMNGNGGGVYCNNASPKFTQCLFSDNLTTNGHGGAIYITGTSAKAIMADCTICSNTAVSGNGGGMYNNGCTLTATNCTFNGNSAGRSGGNGGGMYITGDTAQTTLLDCIFTNNVARRGYGGGMNIYFGDSLTMTNCTFSNNSSEDNGAGAFANGKTITVTGCLFNGNIQHFGYGGGLSICGSLSATVNDCLFSRNEGGGMLCSGETRYVTNCIFSDNKGGGIAIYGSSPLVANCIFSGNSGDDGGGMAIYYSSPLVTHCTFTGNSGDNGGGIYVDSDTVNPSIISNCILWGNDATRGPQVFNPRGSLTYRNCDIQDSGSGEQWDSLLGTDGGGNIAADPLFVDADSTAGADGIWRTADDGLMLQAGSPCIDAGLADDAPTTDILGQARVGTPDIGAYEYAANGPTPTPTETPAETPTATPSPTPLEAPEGRIAIGYAITRPTAVGPGQSVQYTYRWTSDGGDAVTHGPTPATRDLLTELELVQAGETWTVTVTPVRDGQEGTTTMARVKILNPENGAVVWMPYR